MGARINCDKVSDNSNHSMVLVDKTNTEVVVYHANWADNANEYCMIKITHWTYAKFVEKFKNIKISSYTP